MKKLALLFAAAATGMFAMNVSALQTGQESFNFHATLTVQKPSDKIMKVGASNKDLLGLIENEFGDSFPAGAQLITYGVGSEEFAVVSNNGKTILLANASTDADSYELELQPFHEDNFVTINQSGTSENFSVVAPNSELIYESGGVDFFELFGNLNINDQQATSNESFSMSNGQGVFELPVGGDDIGNLTGGASGSGKDVDTFLDEF